MVLITVRKVATLKEIADKVGVSVTTVSRVLNNDSGIVVSDETKMQIFHVAEELEYKTAKQRKAKNKNMTTIGIAEMYDVVKQLEDPYYLILKNIVEKRCFESEIKVVGLFKKQDSYELVDNVKLDGIIAIGRFSKDEIEKLKEKSENIVFLDSSPNDEIYDGIKVNFKLGVNQALNYFIKFNHKEIGFIGARETLGDLKELTLDDRLKFFCEYMHKCNLLNEDYIIDSEMTSNGGYEAVKNFINSGKKMPTAFFVANDVIGTGVMRGLQESGYKIPEDVSIIAFNDTVVSQYSNPPLTSIRVHMEYLGEVAVELMQEKIAGRKYPKKVIIPSEFVVRESVKELIEE